MKVGLKFKAPIKFLLAISSSVLFLACSPVTRVNTFDQEIRSPTSGKVDVFLIHKARGLGANAIVVLSQDKQLDGYIPIGGIPIAVNRRIVRAAAIVKTGNKIKEKKFDSSGNRNFSSVADELIKLKKLKDEGVLSQEEFDKQKKRILDEAN